MRNFRSFAWAYLVAFWLVAGLSAFATETSIQMNPVIPAPSGWDTSHADTWGFDLVNRSTGAIIVSTPGYQGNKAYFATGSGSIVAQTQSVPFRVVLYWNHSDGAGHFNKIYFDWVNSQPTGSGAGTAKTGTYQPDLSGTALGGTPSGSQTAINLGGGPVDIEGNALTSPSSYDSPFTLKNTDTVAETYKATVKDASGNVLTTMTFNLGAGESYSDTIKANQPFTVDWTYQHLVAMADGSGVEMKEDPLGTSQGTAHVSASPEWASPTGSATGSTPYTNSGGTTTGASGTSSVADGAKTNVGTGTGGASQNDIQNLSNNITNAINAQKAQDAQNAALAHSDAQKIANSGGSGGSSGESSGEHSDLQGINDKLADTSGQSEPTDPTLPDTSTVTGALQAIPDKVAAVGADVQELVGALGLSATNTTDSFDFTVSFGHEIGTRTFHLDAFSSYFPTVRVVLLSIAVIMFAHQYLKASREAYAS